MYRDWMYHGGIPIQGFLNPASFGQAQLYYFDEDFHRRELLPWYDHHLKGVDNDVMRRPNVRLRASHRAEDPDLTTELRPFHSHQSAEPVTPGEVYELRIELLPMSFLARAGDRVRLEVSNNDSLGSDAPMTHWHGQKVGTDSYHHSASHPSALVLHERPRINQGADHG